MERIDVNNTPKCANCGEKIHVNYDWEKNANSHLRSAVTAPVQNQGYQNAAKHVESIFRAGGWQHTEMDLSHDAAPHDKRTVEQEHDRFDRVLENEPEHVKRIRATMKAQKEASIAKAAAGKPFGGKKPTTEELMADATPEELAKWNKYSSYKLGQ
jgi:hypothetical protein